MIQNVSIDSIILNAVLDSASDNVYFKDLNNKFIRVNQSMLKHLGADSEDAVLGKTDYDFFDCEHAEKANFDEQFIINTGKSILNIEEQEVWTNGKISWVSTSKHPLRNENGKIVGTFGISRDITHQKKLQERLRVTQERYSLAIKGANDGIWDWNIQDKDVFFSKRWLELLGYDEGQIYESMTTWIDLIHPDERQDFKQNMKRLESGALKTLEYECRMKYAHRCYRWIRVRGSAFTNANGVPIRAAGSISDIQKQKEAQIALQHAALHDPLTDLANRQLFLDRLGQVFHRKKRHGGASFAVIYLDLDDFKGVNDKLGHQVGDKLLQHVGKIIERCLRREDTIARIGGDEFTMILDHVGSCNEAEAVINRIIQKIQIPVLIDDHKVQINASAGLAYVDEIKDKDPTIIMREADNALYQAKAAGRNRYQVYDEELNFA